ncbi:glucooligosaccharide oxidase [Mycena olivaceomarginata]|nr:glucooligosaccharide oxidase [Mycena olivaceomarginata]
MFKFALLLFLVATLARSSTAATVVSCLEGHGLEVEDSQSPNWMDATTPFNTRFRYIPAAIVYPNKTSDVSEAVLCAVKYGLHVSALSGGHSYSASGYGSRNGTLVFNLRNMRRISRHSSSVNNFVIQSGIRLGDMASELYSEYNRSMAHGTCPWVGLGGHAGFGGWGLASRNWGLVIDQVLNMSFNLPSPNVLTVIAQNVRSCIGFAISPPQKRRPKISKAIRGASASYGIVTQYTMKTQEAPVNVTRFAYNFAFNFTADDRAPERFAEILSAYQNWSFTAPKEIGIVANVWQLGQDLELGGIYMGSRTDFDPIAASLLNATGEPSQRYIQERSWIEALEEVNGGTKLSTEGIPEPRDTFYAKSLVVSMENPLAPDSFSKLAKNFTTSIPSNFSWFIQFELWGGHNSHISSIPADATAYPHRNHHWTVQFYGRTNGSWFPQYTEFVDGLADTLAQGKELGAYANYLDPYLQGWKKKVL